MFRDRKQAGKALAEKLLKFKDENGIVLGISRGGVVPAFEVAKILGWPLDVFVSRKITPPLNPELALGAATETGHIELNDELINSIPDISPGYIAEETDKKRREAKERMELLRNGRPLPNIKGKAVIIVDDGAATGFTMLAAINSLKEMGAGKLIAAIPVMPKDVAERIKAVADDAAILEEPEVFSAVGEFYYDFPQVGDKEIINLLLKK